MSGRRSSGGHRYPRSARLNETLREVIAEELVRIDDERLAFVTITKIDADNELNRAIVYFDSLEGEDGDEPILDVLEEHRRRIQSSINRQMRTKKTPVLVFRPDDVIRAAERIEDILRTDRAGSPGDTDLTGGASTPGHRPRPGRGRQAGRDHQPRRRRHAAAAPRGAAGRPRRHARPQRHGCARRRRRVGDPAAALRR